MSTHTCRGYVFTITYGPQDPAYNVSFPNISEIISNGATLSEALAHASEALDLHLEGLQKLRLPLPKPRHRLVLGQVASD